MLHVVVRCFSKKVAKVRIIYGWRWKGGLHKMLPFDSVDRVDRSLNEHCRILQIKNEERVPLLEAISSFLRSFSKRGENVHFSLRRKEDRFSSEESRERGPRPLVQRQKNRRGRYKSNRCTTYTRFNCRTINTVASSIILRFETRRRDAAQICKCKIYPLDRGGKRARQILAEKFQGEWNARRRLLNRV